MACQPRKWYTFHGIEDGFCEMVVPGVAVSDDRPRSNFSDVVQDYYMCKHITLISDIPQVINQVSSLVLAHCQRLVEQRIQQRRPPSYPAWAKPSSNRPNPNKWLRYMSYPCPSVHESLHMSLLFITFHF